MFAEPPADTVAWVTLSYLPAVTYGLSTVVEMGAIIGAREMVCSQFRRPLIYWESFSSGRSRFEMCSLLDVWQATNELSQMLLQLWCLVCRLSILDSRFSSVVIAQTNIAKGPTQTECPFSSWARFSWRTCCVWIMRLLKGIYLSLFGPPNSRFQIPDSRFDSNNNNMMMMMKPPPNNEPLSDRTNLEPLKGQSSQVSLISNHISLSNANST